MNIEIVKSDGERRVSIARRGEQKGLEIRRSGMPVEGEMSSDKGYVYLVIDRSGSMAGGSKLSKAKGGAVDFAKDAVRKNYSVGLVVFGSLPERICEPQRSAAALQQALETVFIEGSTDMAGAIWLTTKHMKNLKGLRAMVVVTDGLPDNVNAALEAAQRAKNFGIDIITIGTDDADLKFLEKLASRRDLAQKVSNTNLREGIASTAKMLPGR